MEQLLKIVYQPTDKTLAFFIKNALSNWVSVSEYSELAEAKCKYADINKDADLLLDVLSRAYVHGNSLRIIAEGFDTIEDFCNAAEKRENIFVNNSVFNVAVLGKVKSGKSILIGAYNYTQKKDINDNSTVYTIEGNKWFEIKGIDLGADCCKVPLETIESTNKTDKISVFIYCVEYKSGKLESEEIHLIDELLKTYPNTRVVIALTNSFDESGANILAQKLQSEMLNKDIKGIPVMPVLAQKAETRIGEIQPYGIARLLDVIYGG